MTDAAIQDELLKHTKIKPKAGETAEAFTGRVVEKVNKMADDDAKSWGELTETAQEWVNTNVTAQSQGSALQLLSLEPKEDEPEKTETAEEAVEESSTKERPVRKAKPKVAAKKKAEPAPKAAKAAKAKPAAKPKTAKAPAAKNGVGRGRSPMYPETGVIKVLVKENPHREGTIRDKAFKKVKSGMTVAEAIKAGCPAQQVWSMAYRKLISVAAR